MKDSCPLRKEYKEETGDDATYTHDGIEYPKRNYCAWLEKELTASRDSRQLSAVPSEEEIDKWYADRVDLIKRDGKYVWSYSLDYCTHGDQSDMLNDFANWIKQRGIAV